MVEASRGRLWNSLTRFYVCLNVLYTLVQGDDPVACAMEKYGITYMGSRNVTKTGKACQAWVAESPHLVHKDIKDERFPDGSKEEAKNFCRNPQPNSKEGIWCYTMDGNVEWEYCDVCPGAFEKYNGCTLPHQGKQYSGKLSHSRAHMECDPWTNHANSQYNFPEGSAEKAKNYCRNPDPTMYEAPWCFISGMPGLSWDYCDICKPFQGELSQRVGAYQTRSVQTDSSMNRLACIHWCITWLTCLAVTIPHGETGSQCWYFTDLIGSWKENSNWDQYNVKRVCNYRAQGKPAVFIEFPGVYSITSSFLMEGSVTECDKACIENAYCLVYDRFSKKGHCYYTDDIRLALIQSDTEVERHIMRCDPSLKPNLDIWENTINQAESRPPESLESPSPEPSEAPLTDITPSVFEINAGVSPGSVASTETPKKKGGLLLAVIVGVLILLLAIGGGGFAYYKLVYQKGKKASQDAGSKGEREKLTPTKPSTSKISKISNTSMISKTSKTSKTSARLPMAN